MAHRYVWLGRPELSPLRLLVPQADAPVVRDAWAALPANTRADVVGKLLLENVAKDVPETTLVSLAEQLENGPRPERNPALLAAIAAGDAKVVLSFAGQAQAYIEELVELWGRPAPRSVILRCAEALADELKSVRLRGLHPHGLDLVRWLEHPASRPPAEVLASGQLSQPLIFVTQVARLADMARFGLDPAGIGAWAVAATGHSQGWFTALLAAEAHSLDTLPDRAATLARFLLWQGVEMQTSWGRSGGAPMLSVTGLSRDALVAHIGDLQARIALENTHDRLVVSGLPEALDRLARRIEQATAAAEAAAAKGQGAKPFVPILERLPVSAPFHSPWMEGAVGPIVDRAALLGANFDPETFAVPVLHYEHGEEWTGTPAPGASMSLAPVRWQATMDAVAALGATHILDLGPGAGVAALSGLATAGQGVRVIATATPAGQKFLETEDPAAIRPPQTWADYAPRVVTEDGRPRLENRFTQATGRPPILLPGMTPTTVDVDIVAAAANAGFFAELAGGGQPTEAILRGRADALRAALEPGEGYVFNALYLDPHLWRLHLGEARMVQRLRAEGHPIEGVTVSAGLPPVDEALALLREWRSLGMELNSLKTGNDAQIEHVLSIAQSDDGLLILQIEGGRAGGHHGFDDLETLLLRWYRRIRRQPRVLLAVGGGIATPARAHALLSGAWSARHGRPPMPVDAVFVGTAAMAAAEATTSPAVKAALVAARGEDRLARRGELVGDVRSGRSGLGADIHYLDNHAGRVAALLDEVAGDDDAARARKDEIIAALEGTAKPYFGDLEELCYHRLLTRYAKLTALGRGRADEDGIWLAGNHRAAFGDLLRRGLRRCGFAGTLPEDADLNDPVRQISAIAAECPALCALPLLPEDRRWFLEDVCTRPGKPVPFVPVIDANVHRWYTRDALWQAHDPRYAAEAVLVIPGPAAVVGIEQADEPIAALLDRFLSDAKAQCPAGPALPRRRAVEIARSANSLLIAGAAQDNPLPAVLEAGGRLDPVDGGVRLHLAPDGVELALDYRVTDRREPLHAAPDQGARLRAFFAERMPHTVTLDADRVAAYRRATGDDGPDVPLQLLFATALPAMLRAVLADGLGADPLSLLHAESLVERLGALAVAPCAVRLDAVGVEDTPAGRRISVAATVDQDGPVGRLVQVFLVRRATGEPQRTPVVTAEWPLGVALERSRPVLDIELTAPTDMSAFAAASGDFNPIHRDAALAALAGLAAPIVHGQWTAATVGARLGRLRAVRARFLAPVALGARLQVTAQVVARIDGDELIEARAVTAAGPVMLLQARRPAPRTALLFPGQGCQQPGMGMDAFARSAAARAVWERADAHTRSQHGFSLLEVVRDNPRLLFAGETAVRHPKGVLHVTQFTQVALTVLAVAGVAQLRERGACPPDALFGGHSVGEYSALSAVTDILPLEALIDVVYHRGLTMQNFVPRDAEGRSDFGMGVIRPHRAGLRADQVEAVVARAAEVAPLYVVNYNVRGRQYAIAGHRDALDALAARLPEGAWVDLPGIDVPFHSPLLSEGVGAFRAVLQRCIPADVDIAALEGRYLPNLVARPFALTSEFVAAVEAATGTPLPAIAADPEAHGRDLLIELLAWQFASPVRWIETQDVLLEAVEQVIELGPAEAPVLGNMLRSTLRGGDRSVIILHAARDHDVVVGQGPEAVEILEDSPAEAELEGAAQPTTRTVSAPAATLDDAPWGVEQALRALVAVALGQPLEAADGDRSLDALLGGNSARRNQVLMDLGKEFGVGPVDGAHELPLPKLAAAITKQAAGYTHPGAYLRVAQDEALKAAGQTRRAAESALEAKWGLPAGRRAAVLSTLAAEGGELAAAVTTYGRRVGQTFSVRQATQAAGPAVASGEATAVAQGRWKALARAALAAGGLDPALVDRAEAPQIARPEPSPQTEGARFDPRRAVAFTAIEHWARADAMQAFHALRRGEPADLERLARRGSPALIEALRWLARTAPPKIASALGACRQAIEADLDTPPRYAGETALITGAGPDSIAERVVARLLAGGARVVVTTSRPSGPRLARFKALYRAHASRSAALHVVPLDQGNLEDVDALVDWLYAPAFTTQGGVKVVAKAPWRPTLCFPFGAAPAEGDPTTYDERIIQSLRVNLIGVERLVGSLGRAALAHRGPRVHAVLPLSPNHGQLGRDGLYAEAKAGLEAMLLRWRSEGAHWGDGCTLVGARIGWVRGTGLMAGLDRVYRRVEAELGVQTFSPDEMAGLLLERCDADARSAALEAPLDVDLTGGFGPVATELRGVIDDALAAARAQARPAEDDPPLPCPLFAFPRLPGARTEAALDPESTVAIVGFGEVGPFGNARIRWSIERDAALSAEAALELAWLCGCVRFDGRSWVDADSGEPVDPSTVAGTYALRDRVGLRPLTAIPDEQQTLFDEVVLTEDLRFTVPDATLAESFRALDPERTEVIPGAEGCTVIRRAGSRIRVPRTQPLDRNVAGQLPDGWDAGRMGFDAAELDAMDPVAVFNLLATADAFRSAGLEPEELWQVVHPARVGCSQGSGIGGMRALHRLYTRSRLDARRQTDVLQETLINVTAAWPAMAFYGGYGPMVHPVAACATAAVSVEVGADLLRADKADFVVAGGFDDLGCEGARGFADMQATVDAATLAERGLAPHQASRPCDARRGGFVEAQGGGTMLLCRGDLALKLGLPIYGLVGGAWSRGDGIQRSVPAPGPGLLSIAAGGERSPLSKALAALHLDADAIGAVSLHGTSTDANDINETALHRDIARAIGRSPGNPLPVIAQKALTGHPKGGAAAWQINGALQAMADGVVPGMQNLDEPDARLADRAPLVYSDASIDVGQGALRAILVTSLGFGHVGAAVLLAHPDVLLATLDPGTLRRYAEKREARWRQRFDAEHAVLLGEKPAFQVRTEGPATDPHTLLLEDAAC